MENRTEKKTVSTVDMTTEVFKAMSQGKAYVEIEGIADKMPQESE